MTIFTVLPWFIAIGFGIFCILDVQKHSEEAFEAAGTPKQTALIITIVGTAICFVGSLYYWFAIRPKVIEAGGGTPPAA